MFIRNSVHFSELSFRNLLSVINHKIHITRLKKYEKHILHIKVFCNFVCEECYIG